MPLAILLAAVVAASPQQSTTERQPPDDFRAAEAGVLAQHVQLTFPSRFVKAGEAYFSPDDSRIVFQAVERPADGSEPDEFYAMFVADVNRSADRRITGIDHIRRVSPPGSANTCGWFDPKDPNVLYFASTLVPPTATDPPGFQRSSGRYRWMFPPEMRIVRADLRDGGDGVPKLETVVGDGTAYVAEGSISPDGRYLLYCDRGQNQGDIFALERSSGTRIPLVVAPGYDGGPFFSPDGNRICYRSDRVGNNLLQLFVADLDRADDGSIRGLREERQVTRDANVNWCPYFDPTGQFLVFATSAVGHRNYEVFAVDAGVVQRDGVTQTRYGTNMRRVTHADGADVLPVFSHDGRWMLWTAQRGDDGSSQLWAAEWRMPVDPVAPAPSESNPHSSGSGSR